MLISLFAIEAAENNFKIMCDVIDHTVIDHNVKNIPWYFTTIIQNQLFVSRTVKSAKKRFIWDDIFYFCSNKHYTYQTIALCLDNEKLKRKGEK